MAPRVGIAALCILLGSAHAAAQDLGPGPEAPPPDAAATGAEPGAPAAPTPPAPDTGAPEAPPPDAPQEPAPVAPPADTPGVPELRPFDALPSRAEVRSVVYTLEGIDVRGNTRTHDRVVLRYIPLRVGDVLDVDDPAVELIRYRLLGTGFFREVELSLEKGSREGQVVLVVTVAERNTVIVNDVWMGLAADADARANERPLTAYAGVDVAETNLAGTGITLGGAMGIAQDQLALRVRFFDPSFLGGPLMTSGTLLFNDGQDFFGNANVLFDDETRQTGRLQDFAVVQYERFGGALGLGVDLSVPTQLWMNYRLERIEAGLPSAASHIRGTRGEIDREPIDFDILPGKSVLSTLSMTLQHDTRNHPVLPTRGWFASVTGEVSLSPLGSEYAYTRVDARASRWWQLPWRHVVHLELFGGAISGEAPFFEKYYVGDLSDFRASRLLGLNVERRPPPNVFDTVVAEVRYGDYAAKINGEYRIPLYRGSRSVYGIDIFGSLGVFAIAGHRDLADPPGGYSGAARIPIDLTGNLGFRMDTSAGGFTVAFANALGFLPALDED